MASSPSSKTSAQKYLTNCKSLYSCIYCRTHLANHDELVSRSFQGNHGRAYLFNSVINILCGPAVQRELNTGSHAVADILCESCGKTLGWKYEKAYVETQKYKEGKYIIELAHVVRENRHLELDKGEVFFGTRNSSKGRFHKRQSSLSSNQTPPSTASSGNWSASSVSSSPSCIVDDDDYDDPELMFPFYDDLHGIRSNYPNSLSLSHYNRMRRSLYLDSTPYDWKHSTTSSSQSSSSSSSSANNSPFEQRRNSYHSVAGDRQTSCLVEEHHRNTEGNDTNDFQFEFEADKLTEVCTSQSVQRHVDVNNCDQLKPGIVNAVDCSNYKGSIDARVNVQRKGDKSNQVNDVNVDRAELPSVSDTNYSNYGYDIDESMKSDNSDSGSDDENFYDCNTDHVVSNLMIISKPPSQH